ncbi:MAG: MBL fold metallo-hydrolase [Candidatus Bathyarchaeota archaeon]|nr:MBL fold metallo-hydrolase [Candidatus Bathyarchaeota archaeon]
MQKRTHTKLLLTIIISSFLITPILSVSAKQYDEQGAIPSYQVTKKVMRFEETIPLSEEVTGYPGLSYRVNIYGVDVGNGVILIDSGDDEQAAELYNSVTNAFNKPILAVYLTHYHSDHAGGGSYFQSQGIPVYAPDSELMSIYAGANIGPDIPEDFTYEGYMPDYGYEGSELYPRFVVIQEPGHTMGAVSIEYRHGNRMYLFTADTIMPMQSDNTGFTDMTFEITYNTALGNYYNSVPGYDLYGTQITTLTSMLETVGGYDYVLTGHINPMDSTTALGYIQYTIGTLLYFPVLYP